MVMKQLEMQEQGLFVNGIELFKIYKSGTIKGNYPKIKEDDRICFVGFNNEYKKYTLYNSVSLVIDKLKNSYQHTDNEYILPIGNQFYLIEGLRTELLVPKHFIFISHFYGELDDEIEIVMYKNLMANQFDNELKRRGIK